MVEILGSGRDCCFVLFCLVWLGLAPKWVGAGLRRTSFPKVAC